MRFFCVFALLIFPAFCAAEEFRYWTGADGERSTIKLKLVESNQTHVRLEREDNGEKVTLPLDQLSEADKKYLASLMSVKVGERAPDFSVTGIDGEPFKLSEKLAGGKKNIVLLFSRGHW